jgi:hypothetical protein
MNKASFATALAVLTAVALAARLPIILADPGTPVAFLKSLGLPGFVGRIPGLAGDFGVVGALYLILSRLNPPAPGAVHRPLDFLNQRAFWPALAYAANPLAVILSASAGQADSLALFLLMGSVYFFEFSDHPLSDRYASFSLGAAAGLKPWFLFLVPLFVKNLPRAREQWRFCLGFLAALAICGLPFMVLASGPTLDALASPAAGALSLPEVLKALCYAGGASPESFSRLASGYVLAACLVLAGLALVYSLGPWQFPLLPSLCLGLLTLYVFAPVLPVAALLWLLPAALLLRRSLAMHHTWLGLGMSLVFFLAFRPEALFNSSLHGGGQTRLWFLLVWAALNLGLWLFWFREWRLLLKGCLRPPGWIQPRN